MSGVNWQNNDYYRALKDYEKESGTTLAERNAAANPYGSHSFGGLIISQLLPQLIMGGAEKLAGIGLHGSGDTGSATDTKGQTNLYSKLGTALRNFDNAIASKNTSDIDKYLGQLKQLSEDNPDSRLISKAYENAKKKKNAA